MREYRNQAHTEYYLILDQPPCVHFYGVTDVPCFRAHA